MKPTHFSRHLKLIFMLLILPVMRADSIGNTETHFDDGSDSRASGSQTESPYWEFLLREFVFKTISPPPPANNKLYKRLLEAPFYKGPLPASIANDDELATAQHLLSRGEVYHLANGGWIICQAGCTECDICQDHKATVTPTVKWTLKRIKRLVPFTRPRYDLQLTVFPQNDGSFHMKNLSPVSYVYVTLNTGGALNSFTGTLINRKNAYQPQSTFATTVLPSKISADIPTRNETEAASDKEVKLRIDNKNSNGRSKLTTSTSIPVTQTSIETSEIFPSRIRGREVIQGGTNDQARIDRNEHVKRVVEHSKPTEKSIPLMVFYPSTVPIAGTTDAGCRMGKNPRLILGTDQFGENHVVHVVPAGYLDADGTTSSVGLGAAPVNRQLGPGMVSDTVHEYEDHPLYRKIYRRVMDSLNDQKSAIEKFLFSPPRPTRPSISPTTFGDEESAGLTTTNIPGKARGGDIDFEDVKGSVVPMNGVGTVARPRDTSSSNYNTAQLQQSSTVEGRRSEPRPTTTRRLRLQRKPHQLDPSMVNYSEYKITSVASGVTSNELRPTVGSSADASTVSALQAFDMPGEMFNGKPDGRRPGSPRIIPAKRNRDEGRAPTTNPRNDSDSLILKEVARSVVNRADTLRGFAAINNSSADSYRNSDDPMAAVVGGSIGTIVHSDRRGTSRRHA